MSFGSRFVGRRQVLGCLSMIGACVVLSGCGGASTRQMAPNQAQVSGSFTNNGKPIAADSRVFFESTDKGANGTGKIDSLGKYTLTPGDPAVGLPAGSYTVSISPPSAPPEKVGSDAYKAMMMQGGSMKKEVKASDIPDKFHQIGTSTLKLDVKAGDNKFDNVDLSKL